MTTLLPQDNPSGVGQTTVFPLPSPSLKTQQIDPNAGTASTKATTQSITPTTTSNQPVIPATTLSGGSGSTQPLNLPNSTTSTAQTASAAVIGGSAGLNQSINDSQNNILQAANGEENQAEQNYNSSLQQQQALINQYLGKGADEQAQLNAAGVPQLLANSNTANAQYLAQQSAYNAQLQAVYNDPNASMEQKANTIADLQQRNALSLAGSQIQATLAQNLYTNAQQMVDNRINIKYGPLKDAIDFGQTFLENNKDILTARQQNQFQAQLAVQQQQYTQGVYYDQLNANTGIDMVKSAAENGADQATLSQMGQLVSRGASFGDVAAAAGNFLTTNSYTPIQTGIDTNTGLPIYSAFNPKTGQMSPLNYNNTFGTTGSSSTVVNGYQLGATTTLGAYASNTQTQVSNVQATVSKIASAVGTITDSSTAQSAINAVSKGSPITGDMVMAAAQQYGVDPATLIGVMQAETQCGTDGSTGAKECNWGNVGNTDQLMANGKSVKMTPQEGVNAVAANLAKRKVSGDQTDPTQATSNTPLTLQQQGMILKSSAPLLGQNAVQLTKSGSAYVDLSKVPQQMQMPMQSWAQKTGTPVLNSDQVAKVNQIETAIDHLTNITAPAFKQLAPSDVGGGIVNMLDTPAEKLENSPYAAQLTAFNDNEETIAQQIVAISGGSADDKTIAVAKNALPSAYDTLEVGNAKLQRSLEILNSNLKTYLPNANLYSLENGSQPTPPAGTIVQSGANKLKINADGSATVIQ